MILDTVKPYLKLIQTGVAAGLLCGAFIAGCNHGESNKDKEVSALVEANKEWYDTAQEANRQVEANKRFAREQMEEAERLAKELDKRRITTDNVITKQATQLQKAKENPTCASLLEHHYCPSAPVYSLD